MKWIALLYIITSHPGGWSTEMQTVEVATRTDCQRVVELHSRPLSSSDDIRSFGRCVQVSK